MVRCPSAKRLRPVLIACCAALAAPAVGHAGWDIVWQDEFDGEAVDNSKWTVETTINPHNNELQAYIPQQVTVADGNLVITSENIPYGGKQYRSGRLHSNHAQRNGRWEVRADLPTSRGMWPAIWLLPDVADHPWPSGGEIDIMENRGNQPHLTSSAFHWGSNLPYNHQFKFGEQTMARFGEAVNFHEGFHTFAVEWDATKLRFFVDDVHHLTLFNADVGEFLTNNTAPMQVTLNTAVGGDFLPPPDSSTVWPQQFLIDYVRVYERSDAPVKFSNGGFEKAGGSLAGWSVFGNKLNDNNVSVHDEAVALGEASLKLWGAPGVSTFSGASQGITVAQGDSVRAAAESFIRAADSIAGTNNQVVMKIEFYKDFGGRHGSSSFISEQTITIADGGSPNDQWRQHELAAVAPAEAVEARLAFVFVRSGGGAGAVHIDNVSFINQRLATPGDVDGDGQVDENDLGLWRRHFGAESSHPADLDGDGYVAGGDFLKWQRTADPAANVSVAVGTGVPEPHCLFMAVTAFGWLIRVATVL